MNCFTTPSQNALLADVLQYIFEHFRLYFQLNNLIKLSRLCTSIHQLFTLSKQVLKNLHPLKIVPSQRLDIHPIDITQISTITGNSLSNNQALRVFL